MDDQPTVIDLAEMIQDRSYGLGNVAGIEIAAHNLRKQAASAYAQDLDSRAEILRNVAREIEGMAKKMDARRKDREAGGPDLFKLLEELQCEGLVCKRED